MSERGGEGEGEDGGEREGGEGGGEGEGGEGRGEGEGGEGRGKGGREVKSITLITAEVLTS